MVWRGWREKFLVRVAALFFVAEIPKNQKFVHLHPQIFTSFSQLVTICETNFRPAVPTWATRACTCYGQQGHARAMGNRGVHVLWATGVCTYWPDRLPTIMKIKNCIPPVFFVMDQGGRIQDTEKNNFFLVRYLTTKS